MSGASRRGWLAGAGALLLSGCDRLNQNPTVTGVLQSAEGLTRRTQRLVTDRKALAKEFTAADISRSLIA